MEIQLTYSIHELLFNALSGNANESQLKELSRLFRAYAFPLVRRRIRSGKLNLEYFGLKENDVVLDCIAELFSRNEHHQLVELAQFFESQQIEKVEPLFFTNLLEEEYAFLNFIPTIFAKHVCKHSKKKFKNFR